jgi:cytochrome P450
MIAVDLFERDLFGGGFPHEVFTDLRRDRPVFYQPFPEGFPGDHDDGFWVLTRHADVQAANRDTETFCSYDGPTLSDFELMKGAMLPSMDGRDHVRQRRLISSGFTPRMIGMLEEQARKWAATIVDRALELETCNFVAEVAYRLPMHMIADIIGIPIADRDWVFGLTNEFLLSGDPTRGITPEQAQELPIQMFEYAHQLGQEKRANPQDDVWTILSTLEVQTDDGQCTQLSELELDMFFLLLTAAGSETTRNAIATGLVTLLDHPEQLAVLRREPDAMKPAVEEILRWASPVSYFARRATRDVEVGGVPIAAGDRVTLWYPSANRDDEVFADPFRFDISRTPNPQVAFGGGGPHFCLGANLARFEISVLLDELLKRTTEIELVGDPSYSVFGIYNPIIFAMTDLPVRMSE